MKYCENNAALLDLYIDGELSPEETAQVREHLRTCDGCRAYVQAGLAIRDSFPDAEDVQVPDGFSDGVMAAIRANAAPRKSKHSRWARTLLPLAACCAIVVLAVTGLPQLRDNAVTETADIQTSAETLSPAAAPRDRDTAEDTQAASTSGTDDGTSTTDDASTATADDAAIASPEPKTGFYTASQSSGEENASPSDEMDTASVTPEEAPAASKDTALSPSLFSSPPSLTLSAETVGDLLTGYVPVSDENGIQTYNLTAEEYATLLDQLTELNLAPADAPTAEEVAEAGTISIYVTSA